MSEEQEMQEPQSVAPEARDLMGRDPTAPAVDRLEPGETGDFAAFIRTLGDGDVHRRLCERMREMAEALHAVAAGGHGKAKGKLTLTVEFSHDKGLTDITAKVKAEVPDFALPRSVRWITRRNNFSASNPQQIDMFPRPAR